MSSHAAEMLWQHWLPIKMGSWYAAACAMSQPSGVNRRYKMGCKGLAASQRLIPGLSSVLDHFRAFRLSFTNARISCRILDGLKEAALCPAWRWEGRAAEGVAVLFTLGARAAVPG